MAILLHTRYEDIPRGVHELGAAEENRLIEAGFGTKWVYPTPGMARRLTLDEQLLIDATSDQYGLAAPAFGLAGSIVYDGACQLIGWKCASIGTAGTITIYDARRGDYLDPMKIAKPSVALTLGETLYSAPVALVRGCRVTITGGTSVRIKVYTDSA